MKEKKLLDNIHQISNILLVILAILGAALPIAGFSFNLGYLSVFGLDANTFPRSISELWQESFVMSALWLNDISKPLVVAFKFLFYLLAFLFVFSILLIILRCIRALDFHRKKLSRSIDKIDNIIKLAEGFISDLKPILFSFFLVGAVFLIPYYIIIDPYQRGKEYVKKSFDTYNTSGCIEEEWQNCTEYLNPSNPNSKLYRGLLIAASNSNIAIYNGKETTVIPRSPDYILVRKYIPKESKDPSNESDTTSSPDQTSAED